MKWKKYKTLTTEQKEEYNFKFSDRPSISVPLNSILFLWSITIIQVLVVYLIYIGTKPFKGLIENIWEIQAQAFTITFAMAIILLVSICYDAISIIIFIYKERKWIKKNIK